MKNRSFIDLKDEVDALKSLYSSFARRYESITESLTSSEVDPKIKESILAAIWNAKSWYALNGHLLNTDVLQLEEIPSESTKIVDIALTQLRSIEDKMQHIESVLYVAQSQLDNFWGYENGFNEWQDNLYEQLRLIDNIYGSNVVDSRSTQLALEQILEINNKIDIMLTRINSFDLPYNLTFIKSSENIDYDKLSANLIFIDDGNQKSIPISDISKFNNLSKLELPELQIGQYLLKIENKNKIKILRSDVIDDNSFKIKLQNDANLIGWYIDGVYPIIEFQKLENEINTFIIRTGNIPKINYFYHYIEERYIDPISIIINVSENEIKKIYDFFYGNFIDEYVETKENGNKVYYRKIMDKDKNYIAVYQMELDYNNLLDNGMPLIKYERLDL